jgi:hypothetical protein
MTDWSQVPATGGWNGDQSMDSCRYQADPKGFTTWHGLATGRLEVDPGDDPLALGENTERSEMLGIQSATGQELDESSASGAQYYAASYYFSSNWTATQYPYHIFESSGQGWPYNFSADCTSGSGNQCNSWSIVLQFHDAGIVALLYAASTAPNGPQTMWLLLAGKEYQFSDGGQIQLGKWMDVVLEMDWSSGAATMWRRNEGQTQFTQVISANEPSITSHSGVYLKQGLYRGGNVNGRTDVLWVGPTARGSTFSAVEQAAFGTNDGP